MLICHEFCVRKIRLVNRGSYRFEDLLACFEPFICHTEAKQDTSLYIEVKSSEN